MPHPYQQIEEQLKKIPEDLQQAISSVDIANKLEEIGKKNNLQLDEIDELIDETGLVMLGLTHTNEYLENLKKRIRISSDILQKIVREVDEQVFINIRKSLREIHKKSEIKINIEDTKKEEMQGLNKEEILKLIENPTQASVNLVHKDQIPQKADLIEEKLKTPISIPQEIINIEEKKNIPKKITEQIKIDPYREPI